MFQARYPHNSNVIILIVKDMISMHIWCEPTQDDMIYVFDYCDLHILLDVLYCLMLSACLANFDWHIEQWMAYRTHSSVGLM